MVNSPVNPTGVVASADEMRALFDLWKQREILLISDEVYRAFCYDSSFASPATWNEDVLVVDGFSKAHGMTGWRLRVCPWPGADHSGNGQAPAIQFRLAPSIVQYAGKVALAEDLTPHIEAYRHKRDLVVAALGDHYDLPFPEGAFLCFPWRPGYGDGVRRRGHPPQSSDHSGACVQPPRQSFPHFLCC